MNMENSGMRAEQKSPEEIKKIEKSRKDYEKSAAKLASKKTSLKEHLTGTGVTKDEIIQADAKLENERQAHDHQYKPSLEELQNSSLSLEARDPKWWEWNDGGLNPTEVKLRGEIKGHEVEIRQISVPRKNYETVFIYEGTIDGKKLSEEDAKKIYLKYYDAASERNKEIENIKDEKRRQREDAPKKKMSNDVDDILE